MTVTFDSPNSPEVANQFGKILWQYVSNGQVINLAGKISATRNQITFEAVNPIDQTILKGPSDSASLRQGLRNRWLHAALPRPLSEDARSGKSDSEKCSIVGQWEKHSYPISHSLTLSPSM